MWVCLASEWLFLTESNWGKTAARCEAQQRGDERKKLMYFWHPWMHREPHCRRHYRFIPELFLFQLLNILKKPPVSCLFNIRFFVVVFFYSWSQEPCNDTVTFHANKQPSQRPSGLQLVYFPFSFPFFNVTYFWLASTNYSPQLNDSAWISEKPPPAVSSQYAYFFLTRPTQIFFSLLVAKLLIQSYSDCIRHTRHNSKSVRRLSFYL